MSKNLWGSKNKSIMWQEKSLNVKEESQMVMNKVLLWKQSVNITGTWNTYRIMASFKKYIYYKEKAAMLQEKKTVGPTFMLSASLVQFFWVFSLSGTGQRRHWHNCGSECSQLVCHPTKATPVISFKFVRDTGTWYTWHLKFKRNCKKISTCGRWHLETTYFSRSRTS